MVSPVLPGRQPCKTSGILSYSTFLEEAKSLTVVIIVYWLKTPPNTTPNFRGLLSNRSYDPED